MPPANGVRDRYEHPRCICAEADYFASGRVCRRWPGTLDRRGRAVASDARFGRWTHEPVRGEAADGARVCGGGSGGDEHAAVLRHRGVSRPVVGSGSTRLVEAPVHDNERVEAVSGHDKARVRRRRRLRTLRADASSAVGGGRSESLESALNRAPPAVLVVRRRREGRMAVEADLEPPAIGGGDERGVERVMTGNGERGGCGQRWLDGQGDRMLVRCEHTEPDRRRRRVSDERLRRRGGCAAHDRSVPARCPSLPDRVGQWDGGASGR